MDFSILTDDQLITLTRGALDECVRRGGAVQAAAQSAAFDADERARIARTAAEREAARLRQREEAEIAKRAAAEVAAEQKRMDWARRKRLARMVRETLGDGWELTVWSKTDLRVYLDRPGSGRRDSGVKLAYYHAGNEHNKPGALTQQGFGKDGPWPAVRAICKLAAAEYTDARFTCSASLAEDPSFADLPLPDDYETAMAAIRTQREREERERPAREARETYGGWLVSARLVDQEEGQALLGATQAPVAGWPQVLTVAQSVDDPAAYTGRIAGRVVTVADQKALPRALHCPEALALLPELEGQAQAERKRRAEAAEAARAEAKRAEQERKDAAKAARIAERAANWPEEVVLVRRSVVSPLHGVETADLRPAKAALAVCRNAAGEARVWVAVPGPAGGYGEYGTELVTRGQALTEWSDPAAWPAAVRDLFRGDETPLARLADLPAIPLDRLHGVVTGYAAAEDSYYGGAGHAHKAQVAA